MDISNKHTISKFENNKQNKIGGIITKVAVIQDAGRLFVKGINENIAVKRQHEIVPIK